MQRSLFVVVLAIAALATSFAPAPAGGPLTFSVPYAIELEDDVVPADVALADFDGDGVLDLFVTSRAEESPSSLTGQFRVFPGVGNGRFGAPTSTALDGPARGITTGDWNRDGHADVAVVVWGDQVVSLLGDGTGHFEPAGSVNLMFTLPSRVTTADFDRDDILDVATIGEFGTDVALGNGDGSFTKVGSSAAVSALAGRGLAIGDVDRDGFPDIAVADEGMAFNPGQMGGEVIFEVGNGAGGFTPLAEVADGDEPTDVHLAELTGDGVLDLLVLTTHTESLRLYRGDGGGSFSLFDEVPVAPSSHGLASADFNADGRDDVVLGTPGALTVFLTSSQGRLARRHDIGIHGIGNIHTPLAIGDLDGDGRPDLVVTSSGFDSIWVVLNRTAG